MPTQRLIPDNPLEFIRRCIVERKIQWTYHINMRLKNRFISRHGILESISSYEIIEAYPEDKYFPSYLVYAKHKELAFHILVAADTKGDNVRIITAYHPNPEEWESDLKTRRPAS
jgi:hypothetical protein